MIDPTKNPFLEGIDLLKGGTWVDATVEIESVIPGGELKDDAGKIINLPDGKPIVMPAIRYKGSDKIHLLNKTNYHFMRLVFGTEDIQEWIGHKVTLYAAGGDWFGDKNQCALRVRVPADRPIARRFRAQLGRDLTGTTITPQ